MSASKAPAGNTGLPVRCAPAASFPRRIASMLYECLLVIGVLAFTFVLPYMIIGMVWQVAVPGWIGWVHVMAVLGAYCVWLWRRGQTLAMRTWRIRLVDAATGGALSFRQALLRYLLCWPSIGLFGAGLLWSLLDRDRQFLHDRLAGTRIVYLGK